MRSVRGKSQADGTAPRAPSTFDFLPLMQDVMRIEKVRQAELAERTGIKPDMISRYLSASCEMSFSTVFIISESLGIDELRAYIAVIRLRNWRLYYDHRLITATDLNMAVVEESMKYPDLWAPAAELKVVAQESVRSIVERKKLWGTSTHEDRRSPVSA